MAAETAAGGCGNRRRRQNNKSNRTCFERAPMDKESLFSKTGKGLLEIKSKSNRLSREHVRVLTLVDGKARFSDIAAQTRMPEPDLRKIVTQLCDGGFIKELTAAGSEAASRSSAGESATSGEDDLDFTRVLGPAKPMESQVDSATVKAPSGIQVLRTPEVRPAAGGEATGKRPDTQSKPASPYPGVAAPSKSAVAPASAPPPVTAFDFDAELAELKRTQSEPGDSPGPRQEAALPPAEPSTPPGDSKPAPPPAVAAASPRVEELGATTAEDPADAFERVRRQAEQQAREEAIRIQQEMRERRARALRKPK